MYIDQYTPQVKKHFLSPHNMGKITLDEMEPGESLATGTVGNPACGDLLTMYLRIKDQRIVDCKVETFGCASAIACSSVTTDMAIGKTIEEAKQIQKKDAADALGGLPPVKMHCSNLASEALHKAIDNYEKGVETVVKKSVPKSPKSPAKKKPVRKSASPKKQVQISKEMTLGAVVTKFPQTAGIMMKFGLHCIGCHVATWESIEQGSRAHGLSDEQIHAMLDEMNKSI